MEERKDCYANKSNRIFFLDVDFAVIQYRIGVSIFFNSKYNILFIVIYLRKNLKNISSGLITGLGSGAATISIINFFNVLITFSLNELTSEIVVSYLFLIVLTLMIASQLKVRGLNIMQFFIIQTTNPIRLLEELKPYWEFLQDKLEAIKILERLKKKEKYGVIKALTEELTKQNTSNKQLIIGITISIVLFIVQAISEGLIQDFFNDSLKDLFCKSFKFFC